MRARRRALFQFPNGIVYHKGSVYITDSNNRRVQVYDKDGNFKKIIVTQGLPRGIDFLNPFPGDKASTPRPFRRRRHAVSRRDDLVGKGDKIVSFGEQGVLDGQFSYPNGASSAANNKIFIADTSNGRIQVWGWPEPGLASPATDVWRTTGGCARCRCSSCRCFCSCAARSSSRPRTSSWRLTTAEQLDPHVQRRRKWFVTEEDYEQLKDIMQGEIELGSPRSHTVLRVGRAGD